jgi:predicted dehydrogenase
MTKVRFAVIGAGWISQEAFLPAVHQTSNAEVTAIVSGDARKARQLADFHGIKSIYDYSRFDEMAKSGEVDAIYVATPNSSHCEYTVRAAAHGLHAMVEKPLAVSVAESEAMIAAAEKAGVYLMTAYRLHNDPATIKLVEILQSGAIGDVRHFSCVFSFPVSAGNHRLKASHWGGPLQDVGVYCLNAARHVFGDNPVRVSAAASFGHEDPRFTEVEEGVAVTMEFPRGRLAQFYAGFGTDTMDMYQAIGTKGSITLWNGFRFGVPRRMVTQHAEAQEVIDFDVVDNFSGMIDYFADCIIKKRPPLGDGVEGLADMQAMLAIEASSRSGRTVDMPRLAAFKSYDTAMARSYPPAKHRLLV